MSALQRESVIDKQLAGAKKQLLVDVYKLMEDPLQMVGKMGNGSFCSVKMTNVNLNLDYNGT